MKATSSTIVAIMQKPRSSSLVAPKVSEPQPKHRAYPSESQAKTSTNTTPPARYGGKKNDVGRIRTCAPEGTSFLGLRDNHSATTPDGCLLVE
jgi:hypothetical protein